jgi:hypothetical protein
MTRHVSIDSQGRSGTVTYHDGTVPPVSAGSRPGTAASAVWAMNVLFTIKPGKGTAIGLTLRTDRHVAGLIQNLDPYVPSPNRDRGKDTYSISLFLVPLDGSGTRLIPLRSGLTPGAFGLAQTAVVSRVDDGGTVQWRTDLGIDRFALQQILPGQDTTAFVGTRPPVPGKVSEPVLVIVDHHTGRLVTHSLWQ